MVTAPIYNKLIYKGVPGVGLVSEILVGKYRDHLPLYRLEKRFERLGVRIPRSSMSTWIQVVVEDLLFPLYERCREKVLESFLLSSDDTTVRVLDRDHPKNIRLGYYWFYTGDHQHVYIDFTPSRSRAGPLKILKSRKSGYMQTDGYAGYHRLYDGTESNMMYVGCWMHARRYFHQAYELKDYRALVILNKIRALYAIEQKCKGISADELHGVRLRESRPIIESIREWLDENIDTIPPRTKLGKAIQYMNNQWSGLTRFLEDGRLPLDNGEIERTIRPVAVGRKNYLFAGSRRGARNAAVIYSLFAGCELNDVKPDVYLRDVLDKLANDWPARRIDDLLPYRWKKLFGESSDSSIPESN